MRRRPTPSLVWARIQHLLRTRKRQNMRFAEQLDEAMGLAAGLEPPARILELTPTEHLIIPEVITTEDKLRNIWIRMGMGKRTFETHLASIYEKLEVHTRAGLAYVATRWGLV